MEAYALYAYDGAADGTLRFDEGVTLKVLNEKDSEWYLVELDGMEGYAPVTYVQFDRPLWYRSVGKAEASAQLTEKVGSKYRHPNGAFLVRPSESVPGELALSVRLREVEHFKVVRENGEYFIWRTAPHFVSINQLVAYYRNHAVSKTEKTNFHDMTLSTVKVSYDYSAANSEEIDIYTGETITVLDDRDVDWWTGQVNRNGVVLRGLFPATYVTKK